MFSVLFLRKVFQQNYTWVSDTKLSKYHEDILEYRVDSVNMLLFHYKLHYIQKVYSREGGSNKATPKSQKRVSPASQYSFRAYSAEGKEETLFGGSDYKMDFLGRFGRILKKPKQIINLFSFVLTLNRNSGNVAKKTLQGACCQNIMQAKMHLSRSNLSERSSSTAATLQRSLLVLTEWPEWVTFGHFESLVNPNLIISLISNILGHGPSPAS